MSELIVEFFGLARAKSKRASLTVAAGSPREALRQIRQSCPALADVYFEDRLSPLYLLSLDGERFLRDLDEPLPAGSRLLLLSADAGG